MPETAARRAGALASLRPRVGVPAPARAEAFALVPILLATWSLGGLYMSLGPSVAAQVFDMPNHVVGGLVVDPALRHRRGHDLRAARLATWRAPSRSPPLSSSSGWP